MTPTIADMSSVVQFRFRGASHWISVLTLALYISVKKLSLSLQTPAFLPFLIDFEETLLQLLRLVF
jgi:hypothetical protein